MGIDDRRLDSGHHHLRSILREMERVMVAFSGGVDSSFLLMVAHEALGKDVLAATARSEIQPREELELAVRLARDLAVSHLVVDSSEMELDAFTGNPPDRCYICKKARFAALLEMARSRGIPWLIDGENADDSRDYRPGSRAARELGVRSPLVEAGLGKQEIRRLSRRLGLPTWDMPSNACLASRIPYGSPITVEKLRQVDEGERLIRGLGLARQVRVRHGGDVARIEVEAESIHLVAEEAVRGEVVAHLKGLGFKLVELDLEGYRMGSLNRALDAR